MPSRSVSRFLFVLLALAPSQVAWSATLFSADFEDAAVGALPLPWGLAGSVAGTSASVADGCSGNATHVMWLHDSNAAATNNTLYTAFQETTRGVCTFRFVACLASIHASFGARVTNGQTPTSGAQISAIGGITFFTSLKLEPEGNLYIDDVCVTSDTEQVSTIAEAK